MTPAREAELKITISKLDTLNAALQRLRDDVDTIKSDENDDAENGGSDESDTLQAAYDLLDTASENIADACSAIEEAFK